MTAPSKKQRAQVKGLNDARTRKALTYPYRMSPYIFAREAEGYTQRHMVAWLNDVVGAPIPSEYTDDAYVPAPSTKRWTLGQYQRFRKQVAVAVEKMAWYAKGKSETHTRPFGDGAGLFRHPSVATIETTEDIRTAQNKPGVKPTRPEPPRSDLHAHFKWQTEQKDERMRVAREQQESDPEYPRLHAEM
jgi:hypothetical protein